MARRIFVAMILSLVLTTLVHAEKIVVVAGGGTEKENTPATSCKLRKPFGVDFDSSGNMYIVEIEGQRLLKVDSTGKLTIIAGTGEKGTGIADGPATKATFNGIHNLAVLPSGDVIISDTWNNSVRRFDVKADQVIVVAGTGEKGFSGDSGPAKQAKFGGVFCTSLDPNQLRLLVADLDNRRIRAIDLTTGIVTTVAGNGQKGVPKNGAVATESPLADPRAVAADKNGNIYIVERGGNALRCVDKQGKIRTVVGTGVAGNTGDDGDALQATLKGPKHLCVEANGDVLIADTDNHVVRRYSPTSGKIVRIAGTGKVGKEGLGGDPQKCELSQPHGVTVDSHGTIFICDGYNDRVLKIEQ